MQKKGGIQQIHSDDAERLLLKAVFFVQQSDMKDYLVVSISGVGLKFHTKPPMAFVRTLIIACRHCIGECEEGGAVFARGPQPFQVETVFVLEHALQAFARNVTLAPTVNGVTDGHVIGRHGF